MLHLDTLFTKTRVINKFCTNKASAVWFLAKKIRGEGNAPSSFKPSINVSILGIAVGVCIMIITLCVVIGFKDTITNKVAGFGNHLQIVNFENNNTYELKPIYFTDSLLAALSHIPHILYAEPFITKHGIIKTDSLFQTIVIKGADLNGQNWQFFSNYLTDGNLPHKDDEVILSQTTSQRIKKGIGEFIITHFIDKSIRVRKYKIVGTYQTGLIDFDSRFVLTTLSGLQRMNQWDSLQVSGIEIAVDDLNHLRRVDEDVYDAVANKSDKDGNVYFVHNFISQNPQIFSWLDLLDMNVVVILILMACVAAFSIITGLVIIILEHVRIIGILKVFGATNRLVKQIFSILGMRMVGKGILLGNIIGFSLGLFQHFSHLIPLNPNLYYVNFVPISFPWLLIIAVNVGMIGVAMAVLVLPITVVAKIEPASVIKFE